MSAFTALNGGSPKATEPPAPESRKTPPEERPTAQSTSQPSPKPPSSEVASSQRDAWPAPAHDRPSFQSASYPDVEGSHKRKRSDSSEPRREREPQSQPIQERTPDTATQPHPPESREAYGTPQREREHRQYAEDSRDPNDPWYSREGRDERGYYDNQHSASTTQGQTEEQIDDALRRVTGQVDNHSDYGNSPEGDDHERSMSVYGPYTPGGSRDHVLQSDPKKRKRNFSNRTKTGCLTCRKRKKKCDEQKPECINCIRGGFLCAGYPPQRSTGWQKPDNKAAAVPLESKDPSYVPPGAYGMPQQNPYGSQPTVTPRRDPLPPYGRGQPLRIDPPQGRPILTDDDRATASTIPSASVASPDLKLSALPYTPANVFPTPVSAQAPSQQSGFSERKEFQAPRPRDPIQISPSVASPVTNIGRVGENVVVEAPFNCDYGYNITIGQNAIVGRNCTIIDTCEVKIGDNCHIGPNVSIYTATLPIDPKRRMGSKGPQLGRAITIEQDCWIGGGAIILPGRTIGKGSTVGAGSIVTKDVPPFTIVVGNPARVLRGISS
ncbi:hypothetical protein VdG1_02368 [Verticillium dahliae VDG1]|nr:hypothetical protein VdG1_02368 [Verticillium dahliae VDG1]